jgi:hypothetical protein
MKRFIYTFALIALTLAGMTTANATDTGKSAPMHSQARHGTKFEHGVYYAGRDHNHWKSCYFDDRFGCYLYMCPTTNAYYYWCEAEVRYYPTSYCPYGNFGSSRVCLWPSCPVSTPTHRPPFNNTIHPIPSPTQPTGGAPTGGSTVPPKLGNLPGGVSILPTAPTLGNTNPTGPKAPPTGTPVPPKFGANPGGQSILPIGSTLASSHPTGPTVPPATNPGRVPPTRRR